MALLERLATFFLRRLFLEAPPLPPDRTREEAFAALFVAQVAPGGGGEVAYELPYPKHEFLRYVLNQHEVLLHGTNRPDIATLEPRQQTDYSGRPITAIFASGDGIWPLFFAVLDNAHFQGSLRNGCFVVGRPGEPEHRFYFFSVTAAMLAQGCWTSGYIYLLPRATFARTDTGRVRFDEWASLEPVRPLARLAVVPEDFPFLQQVVGHEDKESICTSWLRYKRRIRERAGG
jgi:hypothetical protein